MANPLKVLTALSASAGAAISGSDGLKVQQGGLTVLAGTSTFAGTTISDLGTVTTADINGGTIDNTSIGASTQSSGKFTTISGSSTLDVGGAAALAGGVTVTGAALNASAVEVSASALSVGGGYGSAGVTVSSAGNIQANGTLTVDSTSTLTGQVTLGGNVVASNTGDSKSIFGTSTGTITVGASASTASFGGKVIVGGDLVVRGTTTSVDSNTVNIGDKNINLGTGSTDLAVLSGGGIDLGTNAEVQWRYDNGNTAWTSNKSVNVATGQEFKINGTSVLSNNTLGSGVTNSSLTSLGTITSLTASALNVTGLAKLDGNVNLGNQSSDIITVTGQLTASEGIAIASGKKVSLNGIQGLESGSVTHPQLGASSAVIVSYNGVGQGSYLSVASSSGGPAPGTFVDISSSLLTLVRGTGIEGQAGGVTIQGGAGGVEVAGEGAGINDISVYSANGGIKLNAAGSSYGVYISSPSNPTGTLVDGALNIASNESYTYITRRTDLGFDTINISGALKQLDTAIGGMNGASVSPTEYYNVRTVVSGTKQSGNSSIVFTLSGNVQGQNGRTPNGSTITGLSASTAASLIQKLGGMSFDVAVRDMTSALWANDLVSVQLSASAVSNGFYWPIVTVDAPAAIDGAEIRLIAVNETANIIT